MSNWEDQFQFDENGNFTTGEEALSRAYKSAATAIANMTAELEAQGFSREEAIVASVDFFAQLTQR